MSYWDTSTLVKLYAKEMDSTAFENHVVNALALPITSRIALYEARSTFHRKEAEGILAAGTAKALYSELLQDVAAGQVRVIEIDAAVEQEYGQVLNLCYQPMPPILLRTLDARHLASARVAGETEVVATDKRLRDAAKMLGFALFPA
jgi:predicted nucleic acid-binding protein